MHIRKKQERKTPPIVYIRNIGFKCEMSYLFKNTVRYHMTGRII